MSTDGWTQIPSKNRRKQPPPPTPSPTQPSDLNPPSRDLTLSALRLDYENKLKTWKSTTCRKSLFQLLDRVRPDAGWGIKKALCLASGSFSRENIECRRRSLWQVVLFVDLVSYLQDRQEGRDGKVEAHAQEPNFTPLDTSFLNTLNIAVLPFNPSLSPIGPATSILSPNTFLYEPFLDMTATMLEEIIRADPPLYIGSSIRGLREKGTSAGELAREFKGKRGMCGFPAFEVDPNVLEGVEVFWREEAEEEDWE